jgi:hypothetical protein
VTGFVGVSPCPAYGQWTAADFLTALRRNGPFVFHGWWNGVPHSIVVCGVDDAPGAQVVAYMDPVRGFVTDQALAAFNRRMSGMVIGAAAIGFNPVHLPNRRPVRRVIT